MLTFIILLLVSYNCPNISASTPIKISTHQNLNVKANEINYRLPNTTKPESYDVFLSTDVANKNFDFFGTVKITIRILKTTNEITLHQRQLKITHVELVQNNGSAIPILGQKYDNKTEFFTISTENNVLEQGSKVRLIIKYKGTLGEGVTGFYRSSYYNQNGEQVYLATTHFEATNARQAFPCYDEPALKANFDISIKHNSEYRAISNMPQTDQKILGSYTITHFQRTPLMSTYLIAFIVSDFAFKEKTESNGFKHRVYVKPTEIENAYFAVNESAKILNAFSDYLQVNFSLPKMDQVGVPNLYFGAMENWGLVTYREQALLYNENYHSDKRKLNVFNLMAHEYSHQWFGNLVSPKWWNCVWLNEGFATLFENIGTELAHPEFNIFDIFVTLNLQSVFKVDDKTYATHPMTYYVEDPASIASIFDIITYYKSGSVLRQFMHAFGESSFKKGLNYYLNKKSYNAATDDDLFESLDRAVKEDNTLDKSLNVKDIFSSWSNQVGFPLLIIDRNYEQNTVQISQERYFEKYPYPEANLTTWYIPYNFDTSNNVAINKTTPNGWLPKDVKSKLIKPNKNQNWTNDDWMIFNKQQTGFYRVLYDDRNYKLIMTELQFGNINKIHPINRAQLIDDLSDFMLTKRLPVKMFFDFIKYMKRETEYAPWSSAKQTLLKMKHTMIEGSQAHEQLRKFIVDVISPFYRLNALTDAIENEPFVKNAIREIAVRLACEFDVKSCLQDSKQLLEKAIHTGYFPSKSTRGLIYFYGIRNANASLIDLIRKRLNSTKNDEERQEILQSLGNIDNKTIVREYLYESIDSNSVLSHDDRLSLFTSIATRSQYGLLEALTLLQHKFNGECIFKNVLDIRCKQFEMHKILFTLSKNVYTDNAKHQFLSTLATMKKGEILTEEQSKHIIDEMSKALESSKSIRDLIGEYILALP